MIKRCSPVSMLYLIPEGWETPAKVYRQRAGRATAHACGTGNQIARQREREAQDRRWQAQRQADERFRKSLEA